MMLEDGGKLELVNQSRRKKLLAAMKERDGEDARAFIRWTEHNEPKTNREDKGAVMVQLVCRNRYTPTRFDFWTFVDVIADGEETLTHFYQRLADVQEFAVNPKEAYIVPRKKTGRPRRELTAEERGRLDALRQAGLSINAIAKELHISNRLVMGYCQK